jgi:hypothetical protein
MKNIKSYLAMLIASVLLLSSCSDSFFDVNTDPNNPSTVTPNYVLPSGLASSAFVIGGYYHALGSMWTQQYAQSPSASQWNDWESYNLTEDNFDNQFTTLYAGYSAVNSGGALIDYEYVRNNTSASGNWKYYAISTLMQAYTFQVLADLYDQIPFTEALNGVKNIQPHYEAGPVVYDSLLSRIDKAMSKDFSAITAQDPGTSDLIFGGDMAKWQQFANTLKLKMYLRYVNVDPNKYKTQIQTLLASNNFLATDAAFSAFKPEETGYNPFYNTFVNRLAGNISANTTMINFLTANSDPRKSKFYTASVKGTNYNGVATGESKSLAGLTIDNYATPTFSNISPVYFFTVEETDFLIAEAQARYGTTVAAQAAFNAGVSASLVREGLKANAISYPYNGIQSIIEQKWVAATNKRAIEAFFDYNRTGYPNFFTESSISVLQPGQRPKRLYFPASERKSNVNTPAKVALTVKVWWGL